jgi:transcriptional regulator GlxA family with amidase domain
MNIAYLLFDNITLLDFIGIYDPLSRIKSQHYKEAFDWDICAMSHSIKDSFGLEIKVDKVKPDLFGYDMIVVPGGWGTRQLQFDTAFIQWLKTAENVTHKVSICTGSLLLGAAGFLINKTATTNFNEYKSLEKYCQQVVEDRIVDDENVITAGAVASSLDVGLYVCEKLIGKENTEKIRRSMDYLPGAFTIRNMTKKS